MNQNECIETERLILRKIREEDTQAVFENWASDPEVTKYLTWLPHENIGVTKMVMDRWMKEYEDPKTHRFGIVIKTTNTLIGSIDVVDYVDGYPEIGYCSAKRYWNQGYMSEAAKAFIKYLFDQGFNKVVIEANENNIGSNRVIEKCGFKFTHKEAKEHCSIFKPEPIVVNWYELEK